MVKTIHDNEKLPVRAVLASVCFLSLVWTRAELITVIKWLRNSES